MVAALVALQLATRPGIQRLHRATFDGQRRSTSLVTELVASIVAVKAAAAEGALGRRWERSFLSSVESSRALLLRVNAVQLAINVVTAAGTTGVLYLAARAALAGELSVGAILAVSMYLQNLVRPTIGLSGLLSTLEEARVAAQKVEEVFAATPEEPPEVARVTHGARIRGKIRLDRVSFRYGADDPLVLKELSLTIYPGQVVAIVGRSGSGKSTLANLLAGHARPTGGRVFYDHYDASMLSRASLRRQIAYVQQGYALFAGTIASNVAFTTDVPDDAQIARAARDAHCQEFVERLPQRFEHTLAPRGLGLSGGQRQRLAIARALHQQPVILVLDEATSALDADAEAAVNENMARMTEGRTTLIVAHRVSTVRRADRILVVHDGEIVEDGDHRTLIARGGPYAELFEGQIDAEDEPSTRAG
jgi:ATP-binding cassette subfamily B protein